MQNLLLIGLGGFMGALLRYGVSGFIQSWSKNINFPYGTLAVNLLGCLLIGMLSQVAEVRGVISPEARSFIFIGLLGAFTTFSTFGNDTVSLFRDGENLLSYINIGLHLVLGLSAVWLGQSLISLPWK
jgi:CrcB protein